MRAFWAGVRATNTIFLRFFMIFLIFGVSEIRVYPGYIRDISDFQDGFEQLKNLVFFRYRARPILRVFLGPPAIPKIHPKWSLWATFWVHWAPKCFQMPFFSSLRGSLNFDAFLEGFWLSLLLHNCIILGPPPRSLWDPFLAPFSSRYPKIGQCSKK